MKELLKSANVPVPLLSPARHGLCYAALDDAEGEKICAAYREQVLHCTAISYTKGTHRYRIAYVHLPYWSTGPAS